jgi:hypothetical protein
MGGWVERVKEAKGIRSWMHTGWSPRAVGRDYSLREEADVHLVLRCERV